MFFILKCGHHDGTRLREMEVVVMMLKIFIGDFKWYPLFKLVKNLGNNEMDFEEIFFLEQPITQFELDIYERNKK